MRTHAAPVGKVTGKSEQTVYLWASQKEVVVLQLVCLLSEVLSGVYRVTIDTVDRAQGRVKVEMEGVKEGGREKGRV